MTQEYGRSMVEMLGVLAIMGVITVGAVGMISTAMRNQKHIATNDEVLQIVTGVRQLLGEYDDYSNIDNSTIFGAIGMSTKNQYGGTYEMVVDPSNTRQFILSITGLGQSDCQYLATKAGSGSVGYQTAGTGGATGTCTNPNGANVVRITYGE